MVTKNKLRIRDERDVIFFRNRLKELANRINLSLISQTKLVTASSELVRNILKYAGQGIVHYEIIINPERTGIMVIFEDKGPGIADVQQAMKEGYTTDKGLGLGLPGAQKLVDEFFIESSPGKGTRIKIFVWKHGRHNA